jgi:hypothetical protein
MDAATCALYAGLALSSGYGEGALSPSARFTCDRPGIAFAATWEGAHKITEGAGYILGGDVDAGTRFTVGLSYRRRNAGVWTKHSWWPRFGIGKGPLRLIVRQEFGTGSLNLGHRNQVTIAELHLRRAGKGRLALYDVIGAGSYIDDYGRRRYGAFAQAWVGVRW